MLGFSHCVFFTVNTAWAPSSGPPWHLCTREALTEWRSRGFSLCEWEYVCWPLNLCHINPVCQHSPTFLQLSVQRNWEQMIAGWNPAELSICRKDWFFCEGQTLLFTLIAPRVAHLPAPWWNLEEGVLSSLRCFQGVAISCCRHQHPHLLNCLGRLNCTWIFYDRRTNSKVKQTKAWVTRQHVGVTYILRDHTEWCSKESN